MRGTPRKARVPIITDASSLINLYHADALDWACALDKDSLLVTPLVLGECDVFSAGKLMHLQSAGKIEFLNDSEIPADTFLSLLSEYGLGDGETESIAAAAALNLPFCCDDKRARNVAKIILGDANIIGSMRILRWCVEREVIACTTAYESFVAMKNAGGFLPDMEASFFCAELDGC